MFPSYLNTYPLASTAFKPSVFMTECQLGYIGIQGRLQLKEKNSLILQYVGDIKSVQRTVSAPYSYPYFAMSQPLPGWFSKLPPRPSSQNIPVGARSTYVLFPKYLNNSRVVHASEQPCRFCQSKCRQSNAGGQASDNRLITDEDGKLQPSAD